MVGSEATRQPEGLERLVPLQGTEGTDMSGRGEGNIRIEASRDPLTGDVFCPARRFAADGSLRRCEPVTIRAAGILYSWTRMGRRAFGQIDLDDGPRIQAELLGESHEIGARYVLTGTEGPDGTVREGYARV